MSEHVLPRDVKPKFFSGGFWKAYQIPRKGKRSYTTSKPARFYVAVPPETGWPGGLPEKNGWKPSGGK